MSLAELVLLLLKASLLAIVFALGLNARPTDLTSLLPRPSLLAASLFSMAILMPIVAVLLVKTMGLPRPVGIMLIALSLAPVPPILPRKQAKAGGDAAYATGLLATAGLASIIWIPLGLELIQGISGLPLHISPGKVAIVVATTILIPLVAGIVVARLVPRLAAKIEPIISKVGGVLLLVAAVAMIASQWTTIGTLIGDGTLLAFVIFIVVGLVAGHILGGPKPNDRTVLAMATSSRHPGVALAIASLNFPGEKAVLAAALLFLITDAIVSIPYVNWRKRTGATDGSNVVAWPTRGE